MTVTYLFRFCVLAAGLLLPAGCQSLVQAPVPASASTQATEPASPDEPPIRPLAAD